MTGQDFVTMIYEEVLDFGNVDANDASWRAKILRWTQRRCNAFWADKPWTWKVRRDSITVTYPTDDGIGNLAGLDPVFQAWGKYGEVAIGGNAPQPVMGRRSPSWVIAMRTRDPGTSAKPMFYAEVVGGVTTGVMDRSIYLYRRPSQTITLDITYDTAMPAVTDSSEDEGLAAIPLQYHDSVLRDGVTAEVWKDQGDSRWQVAEGAWEMGLKKAWKDESPRNEPLRTPIFGARMRRARNLWAR